MSQTKFPLCDALKLPVVRAGIYMPHTKVIDAENVERLLSEGVRVWGYVGDSGGSWSSHPPGTFIQETKSHTALLVAIEPVKKLPRKRELTEEQVRKAFRRSTEMGMTREKVIDELFGQGQEDGGEE